MNTNDNTEPCPTCSMAVNKSAIKLAARVAELEAENARLRHEHETDLLQIQMLKLLVEPRPSVSDATLPVASQHTQQSGAMLGACPSEARKDPPVSDYERARRVYKGLGIDVAEDGPDVDWLANHFDQARRECPETALRPGARVCEAGACGDLVRRADHDPRGWHVRWPNGTITTVREESLVLVATPTGSGGGA